MFVKTPGIRIRDTQLSRGKEIKRVIKDIAKKKCRHCNHGMELARTVGPDGPEELLRCKNYDCRFAVKISRTKRSVKHENRRPAWRRPLYDEKNQTFKKTFMRLKDKYYFVGDTTYYNPIRMIERHIHGEEEVKYEDHIDHVKYILKTNA